MQTRAELLAEYNRDEPTITTMAQRGVDGTRDLLDRAMTFIRSLPSDPADEQRCAWCGDPMDDETVALAKRCDLLAPEGQALCSLRCFREIRREGATPDDFRPFTVTDSGGGNITIRVDRDAMQYAPTSMRVRVSEDRDGTHHQG